MKLSDFDYFLPSGLIAQDALEKRRDARLLVLDRNSKTIEHRVFSDVISLFKPGDVLVLNDTKVIQARLFGIKRTGGEVEILLLKKATPAKFLSAQNNGTNGAKNSREIWRALVKPSRRVKEGEELSFEGNTKLKAQVLDSPDGQTGIRLIRFECEEPLDEVLQEIGHIPLPPYIDRKDSPIDRELYQTVFAKKPGAVASPTAGLHFDEALLDELRAKGVEIVFVTLHVSYGTFQPVAVDDLSQHRMYEEYFEMTTETVERINVAKSEKRRVIACGTTVVRTLETVATRTGNGMLAAASGETNLFIYPPYSFKIVDGMITNFHLPKTTLLMLVSAFSGYEFLMKAYREAVEKKYRFYSYGDAMMIV